MSMVATRMRGKEGSGKGASPGMTTTCIMPASPIRALASRKFEKEMDVWWQQEPLCFVAERWTLVWCIGIAHRTREIGVSHMCLLVVDRGKGIFTPNSNELVRLEA